MTSINIPRELLPEGIKNPAIFFAEKRPNLPDCGIDTGDIVVIWNCQEMCSRRTPKILDRQESGSMMSRLG